MSEKTHRKAFSKEIEALRRQQGLVEPMEIARLVLNAGLLPHEALEEIRDHFEYRYMRSTDLTEALALFVSSLCDNESSGPILGNYPVDVPHKRPYIKDTWLAPTEGTAKCPTPQRSILKY